MIEIASTQRRYVSLNSFEGKRLLSMVRSGDFAHPGEQEAIDLILSSKDLRDSYVLDAGCGRGGTADHLKRAGSSHVVGVDLDTESIEYASSTYRNVVFYSSNLLELDRRLLNKFNNIFMFNVLYSINDKLLALSNLSLYGTTGASLCIFDYISYDKEEFRRRGALSHTPPSLPELCATLTESGWVVQDVTVVDKQYIQWYEEFVLRFSRCEILGEFPEEFVNSARSKYQALLDIIKRGVAGGAIVWADLKSPHVKPFN